MTVSRTDIIKIISFAHIVFGLGSSFFLLTRPPYNEILIPAASVLIYIGHYYAILGTVLAIVFCFYSIRCRNWKAFSYSALGLLGIALTWVYTQAIMGI